MTEFCRRRIPGKDSGNIFFRFYLKGEISRDQKPEDEEQKKQFPAGQKKPVDIEKRFRHVLPDRPVFPSEQFKQ
jgi:hypothetical protein